MTKSVESKVILSGDATGAKYAIGQTEPGLKKLGKKAKSQSKDVEAFGSSFAGAFKAAAASLVAAQFVEANKSLEQLERGFKAVTGSSEAGAIALGHAKDLAEQLGFSVTNPEIKDISITSFDLKSGGQILGQLAAVTEATDLSQLTPERWARAAACWMVRLCDNDADQIRDHLIHARAAYQTEKHAIDELSEAKERAETENAKLKRVV